MHELHRPCRIFPESVYNLINHEKTEIIHQHLYYSQKQLPSAWNESDWLANCRPIHIVKLRENRKRFS